MSWTGLGWDGVKEGVMLFTGMARRCNWEVI
jgi:hypothetical protein